MTENPKIKCEKCESKMTRIITGGTGFILGPGFPGKEISLNKKIAKHIPGWQKRGEKPPLDAR